MKTLKKLFTTSLFILCAMTQLAALDESSAINSYLNGKKFKTDKNNKNEKLEKTEKDGKSLEKLQSLTKSYSPQLALATEDYRVTPGDVYTLAFMAGGEVVQYSMTVDTSYKLRVANLAVLNVRNRKLVNVKRDVEAIVTKNYPLSGVQFILTMPGYFMVKVKGEVQKVTEVQAWSLTRLSEVIEDITTDYSSKRDVVIKHRDGTEEHFDLFEASRNGDMSQDPYIREGDTVIVQRKGRLVELIGEVEKEEVYELKDGENLKQLIEYYGHGYTNFANKDMIQLSRFDENQNSSIFYLTDKDVQADFQLKDYDSVTISSINDLMPVIFIEGAIINADKKGTTDDTDDVDDAKATEKITMQFIPDTNYTYFIRANRELFNTVADLENAYVLREGSSIPMDISKILYNKDYFVDEKLLPHDKLIIPFRQYFVSVAGAVAKPGRYPYIPNRDYLYYVNLAGGFLEDRNNRQAVIITDYTGKRQQKKDFIQPEYSVFAKSNSFTYYFGKYSTIITTCLTIVSTSLAVYSITK